MKAVCTFCGHSNRADAQSCAQCGGSLADAPRQRLKTPWASWVPIIPMAALLWFQFERGEKMMAENRAELSARTARTAAEHQAAMGKLQADHNQREAREETKHRAMLSDTRLISGVEASAKRSQEWQRRQNHEPAFARTVLERTLLDVERLGKDPAVTAEAALNKVAELVTPPGSRIEVTSSDRGFIVRVAFRLSAVKPDEAGGSTRHTSSAEVRKEIEEATARLIKDLFIYSGARGIHRLSVSCNRAILSGKDDTERLVMRSLYRASMNDQKAGDVSSWRHLSIGQVASLMQVEHDVISSIIISTQPRPGLALDPNEPLEF